MMPVVQMQAIGLDAGDIVDVAKLQREIEAALAETNDAVDNDYRQFYGTWRRKPTMPKKVFRKGNDLIGEVSTEEETDGNLHLLWIDEGTGPRDIYSKGGKPMRFQHGFGPKTARRRIRSTGGKEADGDWTSTHHVRRHRIEAREISDEIAKTETPDFIRRIQAAIDKGTS